MIQINQKKIQEIKQTTAAVEALIRDQTLKSGEHYMKIPGNQKDSLMLSGAELLAQLFDINVKLDVISDISDPNKNLVDITIKATAYDKDNNFLGEALGNCNSNEEKFGFEWKEEKDIPANISKVGLLKADKLTFITVPKFVIDNGVFNTVEQDPKYGKPKEEWNFIRESIANGKAIIKKMETLKGGEIDAYSIKTSVLKFKVPTNAGDKKNTIVKMSEKRAYVSVVKRVTNSSSFFTQDIDENVPTNQPDTSETAVSSQVSYKTPPVVQAQKPEAVYYPILNSALINNKIKETHEEYKDDEEPNLFVRFLVEKVGLSEQHIKMAKGLYVCNKDNKAIKEIGLKPFSAQDLSNIKEIFNGKDLKDSIVNLSYREYLRDNGFTKPQ